MKKILTTLAAASMLVFATQVSWAEIASQLTSRVLWGQIEITLPTDNGDAGEQLQTDGAGVLTWEAAGGGSGGWTDSGTVLHPTTATDDLGNDATSTAWSILDTGAASFSSVSVTPSATPNILFTDSTDPFGEAKILVDGNAAGPDSLLDLQVDVAGTLTSFVQLDGVTERIDLLKPMTLTAEATPTTDADGELSVDTDGFGTGFDAIEFFNGTASAYVVAVTASDTPSNGNVPMWNTGGEITWENAAGDITAVGDCTSGACFTATGVGTLLRTDSDFIVELDNNNDGSESFQIKSGGDAVVAEIDETGAATFSSVSGTGAINLTGTINGAVTTVVNSADTADTLSGSDTYGSWMLYSNAGQVTVTAPGVAAGMNFCVYDLETTADLIIDVDGADIITLNGLALSAGDSIKSAGDAGDFVCLVGVSTSSWITLGRSGAWTDNN